MKRIAIGADHKGFKLKEEIKKKLEAEGHQVTDLGGFSEDSVDYPDFACRVGKEVSQGKVDCGIAICWSGTGMTIAANKVKGIRAALCVNADMARLAREHNDANVLALGSRYVTPEIADLIVSTWIKTEFAGGRHQRRVEKIKQMEEGKGC
jgi:ribose 5-phosphate isomerase B